ncbi:hypothetical protein [Bacillus infantis]|uniref:hypothetical protein n=1 Tax=Bacillus infantis TaxID=324767 RepID=UPI00209CED67|nr:hypothetical protein [Bacillus infantis]MCP1161374.1 hypothetical protein [Bacillus infantis]
MEINGVQAVIIFVGIIIAIGAFPTIAELFHERQVSKWSGARVYNYEQARSFSFEGVSSYSNVQPKMPLQEELLVASDIPVFSADEVEQVDEVEHSIPTDDLLVNVDKLVSLMQDNEIETKDEFEISNSDLSLFATESFMDETGSVPSILPENEYNAISKEYGNVVANMITATPTSTFSDGYLTMIGKVGSDGECFVLKYKNESIKMIGPKVPVHVEEVVIVSGHFIADDKFQVEEVLDPELIKYGYYESDMQHAVI